MEDHASLGQYLFGAGLLLVCLLAALSLSWLERRRRSWSRSIIVHAVQLSFMFCALGVARHYVRMAIVDYQLNWISPGAVDVVTVILIVGLFMYQLSMLINRLENKQISKGRDPTSAHMIGRVMKFGIFIVMLLFLGALWAQHVWFAGLWWHWRYCHRHGQQGHSEQCLFRHHAVL